MILAMKIDGLFLESKRKKEVNMRKPISEIGHKWQWSHSGDYIVIDIHNSNFHPGTHCSDSPKFAKVMYRADGTAYIRFHGVSWDVR